MGEDFELYWNTEIGDFESIIWLVIGLNYPLIRSITNLGTNTLIKKIFPNVNPTDIDQSGRSKITEIN